MFCITTVHGVSDYLYSEQRFCFHYSLIDTLIIINTFVPKLHFYALERKKVLLIFFKTLPSLIQVAVHMQPNVKKKSPGILHCKRHEMKNLSSLIGCLLVTVYSDIKLVISIYTSIYAA